MQSERDNSGRQLDFTRVSLQDILPIFDVDTSISTIDAVLGKYEPLIAQGKSVAVACDFQWTGKDPDRMKEDAAAALVGLEKKMWDLAQLDGAHVSLPSMDFDVDGRATSANKFSKTDYLSQSSRWACHALQTKRYHDGECRLLCGTVSEFHAPPQCCNKDPHGGKGALVWTNNLVCAGDD